MKYRFLEPNEIEAYEIGYKVGSRQIVITDIVWETDSEHKIYRQGYLAGCKDRLRQNVNNVNNVNSRTLEQCQQCLQCQKRDSVYDTDTENNNNILNNNNNNNILNNNTTCARKNPSLDEILEYAREQNSMAGVGGFACTDEQAQDFYDYYSGIGWVLPNDSRTPIVDWRPFLRKWVRNPRFKAGAVVPDEEDSRFKYEFTSAVESKKGGTK